MKNKKKISVINQTLLWLKNKKWFTFVELIIAITIIAILSVLWFVSYSSHLSSSRDSTRKSELSDIYSLLDSYKLKAPLMVPDKRIDIYSSWILLWFQWYLSNEIIKKIWFKWNWKDPLDQVFYTYYLTKDFRNPWVMGYLENNPNKSSFNILKNYSMISKVNALDYKERYPIIFWKKLWIIIDDNNLPIQENQELITAWKFEVNTISPSSNYIAFFDNKTSISSSWYSMEVLYWTSVTWVIWNSCEQYIEEHNWEPLKSWIYLINSSTWVYQQLCNMETTTWSWVETRIATCSWSMPTNSFATRWNDFIQTFNWTAWDPPFINWWENKPVWESCDFDCNSGYTWSWATNTCLQKIHWVCGTPQNIITQPIATSLCAPGWWNAGTVSWIWPSTWTCFWINWWTDATNCTTTTYCMVWWMFPCKIY